MSRRMVIFGCGYVGRPLAEAAAAAGWEVWIHSRNAESLAMVGAVPPERRIVADLHGGAWHDLLREPVEAAINLVSSAGNGLEGYELSYLEGNRSIARWAEKVAVGRFLFTSATSVYPQTDGRRVTEADVPDDPEALSPNGRVLRQAEKEILAMAAFPERMVLRLGGIYGPGRHLYLDRLRAGETTIPGEGRDFLNLIHRDDIVSAIFAALRLPQWPPSACYNVVDDAPAPKADIAAWLAERLGVPAPRFDPALAGRRSRRRRIGGRLPNRRVDNRAFRELAGWAPRHSDFRSGYRELLEA